MKSIYTDENGYLRYIKTNLLVHRDIALNQIYLIYPIKYPFPFESYVVHHIDENKKNNEKYNLYICTKEEHELIHQEKRIFNNSVDIDYFLKGILPQEIEIRQQMVIDLSKVDDGRKREIKIMEMELELMEINLKLRELQLKGD